MHEVDSPIICSPFAEPDKHWRIVEGEPLGQIDGRRPSVYYYRPPTRQAAAASGAGNAVSLELVNELRDRVQRWRQAGYPGVSRTTADLLKYWRRDGRKSRFFFAQMEAAETIIFLVEARHDFRQGVEVPRDEPSDERKAQGYAGFTR